MHYIDGTLRFRILLAGRQSHFVGLVQIPKMKLQFLGANAGEAEYADCDLKIRD
jgi:hypothetical protein